LNKDLGFHGMDDNLPELFGGGLFVLLLSI
jgi:hypothetical protein